MVPLGATLGETVEDPRTTATPVLISPHAGRAHTVGHEGRHLKGTSTKHSPSILGWFLE